MDCDADQALEPFEGGSLISTLGDEQLLSISVQS